MAHHSRPHPAEGRGPIPPRRSGTRLRDRGRRILAATATAALLLTGATACGGTAESPAPQSSPAPKEPFVPAQLAQAWKTAPAEGHTLRTPLMATWRTKTAYYVGRGTGIEILDPATGKPLGTLAPPEPDMHPCGMTEGLTADGLGAIAWIKGDPLDTKASCDRVSLIDTRNGNAIAWTKQVSGAPMDGKPLTDDTTRLAFIAGGVLAVMTPNTVVGMRPDGTEAWTWRNAGVPLNEYVLNWTMSTHHDRIMVVLAVQRTGWRNWVVTLDATGKELSPEPVSVPKESRVGVIDGGPMAVILTPSALGEAKNPELMTFTREGRVARVIPLASDAGPVQLNRSSRLGRSARHDIAFSGSTAYVVAGDSLSSSSVLAQIVAFDLETGATRWTQPVDTLTIPRFLGSDKDMVYVLGGKATKDMAVYAYAANDGTRTQISTVKAPDTTLSLGGVAVDYGAGSLALTDPGRYTYGTVMFRSPTP
ncbi:PQQ-binding-like beta-propeller repeat protein [Streptomyces sp. NPDC058412]|uniref:outer membrane protein assembly factor BamB family protein n=1 Tax=Streptomyces sp. NPDC058412 TaxID=3346486 RepID=UPI003655A576